MSTMGTESVKERKPFIVHFSRSMSLDQYQDALESVRELADSYDPTSQTSQHTPLQAGTRRTYDTTNSGPLWLISDDTMKSDT